jgi:hypothetical protein
VAARGATGVAENKVGKNGKFSALRKAAFLHHVLPHVSPQLHHVVPSKNVVEIAKPLVKQRSPIQNFFYKDRRIGAWESAGKRLWTASRAMI